MNLIPFKLQIRIAKRTAIGCLLVFAAMNGSPAVGGLQEDSATPDSPAGMTFSEPVESVWEFGLKINSTGNSKGITASVPIPMDWPEQEIEVLSEEKTANVGAFKQDSPTKHTRQFSFNVNRITGQQSESGYIRFRIKKRMIIAPSDTTQFVIAKQVPREVKTFLQPSPYIESKHKRIRELAESLEDNALSGWQQVEKNYRWVRENVEYKFDTQIHSCLEALDSEHGDCEELSSLFIAICRAQGIPARAVWIPDHTYPEFYLEDQQGEGHWFPCQAAGQYEFGAMTESKPILQKGDRFRMPGERQQVRYVRPTLVARQPNGQITIEWISRQIQDDVPTAK